MNRILKILILIVYTFAIFALAFFIVSITDKGANFKDYKENYKDENIAVVTQIIEKRQNKKQTKTDFEKSSYDVYFFVKKISSVEIKNLYVYVAAETEEGIRYIQSSSAKNMSSSTSVISTISVLNSTSNSFAVNQVEEKDGVVTHINKIPENFYIKVAYEKVVSGETTNHELNYKIKYDDINKEKFEGFEKRDILTTKNDATDKIDPKNDYVEIKFLKLPKLDQESTEDYNDYRISTLRIAKSKLPTNIAISKLKLEVTAETTNFSQSDTDHFSKYVKLFVYEGALVDNIPNSRTVSLAEAYKVEKIYFDIEVELENGKVEKFKYYVLTSELLEG